MADTLFNVKQQSMRREELFAEYRTVNICKKLFKQTHPSHQTHLQT